ncbi:hypothetical protein IWW45_002559, partial [Coemansia sp. RSA 485]
LAQRQRAMDCVCALPGRTRRCCRRRSRQQTASPGRRCVCAGPEAAQGSCWAAASSQKTEERCACKCSNSYRSLRKDSGHPKGTSWTRNPAHPPTTGKQSQL